MRYTPDSIHRLCPAGPVVRSGEFRYAAIGLEHGHIHDMCEALNGAGAELGWVYDPDSDNVNRFLERFPGTATARNEAEILDDPEIRLVVCASVPADRCAVGIRAMEAGKDFLSDKPPLTTLEQLSQARETVARTGQKYLVDYTERLHSECAEYAGFLIQQGTIGRVLHVVSTGPHRLQVESRPRWFFQRERYGGILCDIGSHQIEQCLYYTGAEDVEVLRSHVANFSHAEYPELEDFGDAHLLTNTGVPCYFRVDWFTPDGLRTWGDGRMTIMGSDGYIELRKFIDVARSAITDNLYLVNNDGEYYLNVAGKVGLPFFRGLILDCLQRTERAMTQEHAFTAAAKAIEAQEKAVRL